MALLLTEADVDRLFTMQDALEAVEIAFRHLAEGKAVNQPRRRVRLPGGFLHLMAGADWDLGVTGFKAYTTARTAHFVVNLYDARSGELLAVMEADRLGQVRTGAATGVATKYMARPDARVLALIGAGKQARTQAEAVCAVRPIQEVRVYSRTPEHRESFAREMEPRLGVPIRPVDSAESAVRGADIVVTITNSREPVLQGTWLEPGTHINAAGSNHWMRREVDEETLRRADLIVVDDRENARLECGELIWAVERGVLLWEGVQELRDVVAGRVPGRPSPSAITLFESQGLAIEDLTSAWLIYRKALEQGVGQRILE